MWILNPSNAEATFRPKYNDTKIFEKNPSKPCHVGIHWIALTEYSQMSTHMPGFQLFLKGLLHHFVRAK